MTSNRLITTKIMALQNVCHLITDGKHGDCQNDINSGYYFLSAKDVRDRKLIYENARQITKDDFFQTHRRTQLEPLDILIVSTGATIGRMAMATDTEYISRTTFQKSVAILKPNKEFVSPHWLFYKLNQVKDLLINMSGGTAQGNLLLRDLRIFEIEIPPLTIQLKIAEILSAYDDLIENNTRRIRILENMAQAIYSEWFGSVNPKSLPIGWEICKLGDLIDFAKGKKPKTTAPIGKTPLLLIESLRTGATEFTDDQAIVVAEADDIIMVMDGASSGSIYTGNYGAVGSTLGRYRPIDRQRFSHYHFYLFILENFKQISDNNIGSAIPHANKDFINQLNVVLPPQKIENQFHEQMIPVFDLIKVLKRKNSNLRQTRDLLLPRLVSGEVEV